MCQFEDVECFVEGKINKTITARNNEIESIKENFDRVLEGGSGVSIIAGLPGIGKTFLVENAVKELASSNATYVNGKFRQHDKKPFVAISEIIEQMVKHLLTLPYEQLHNVKYTLKKALGSDVEIITSISPYAKKLLGEHKNLNTDDYEKLKYKVRKALYQFIVTVSEPLFPLIMFIDDLQWADKPSLEVIEIICKDKDLLNLLLILVYRDNEEKYRNKVEKLIKVIQTKNDCRPMQLHELTDLNIKEHLQLIFGVNFENIDYLTRIVFGLTLGNPFHIKEIIDIFIEEGIIVYISQKKQWVAEINNINKLSLPTNIEQIIINKINKLSDEDKSLLEIIACLDGKIDLQILRNIVNIDDTLLLSQLQRLCKVAFLVKTVEDYKKEETIIYGFAHDIILELIYREINSERREKIHYNIAKNLIDENKMFAENNRLFIASQLLRSDYNLLREDDKWIFSLYNAGIDAKQATAMEQALKIFECCEKLLSYSDLEDENQLEKNINLELGECQFICGKQDQAKERFEALIKRYTTNEDLITIKRKYMNLYSYSGNSEKVLKLGIEVLEHLNFKINSNSLIIDLIKGKLLLSNKKIKKLMNADTIRDKRIIMILETLTQMAPSANHINEKIFKNILLKAGVISVKYGNSSYAPIGYAVYSFIFHTIWKNHEKGRMLADITVQLLETENNISTKSICYFLIGTFIEHLTSPMKQAITYLEKSVEEGMRIGEFLYSGYSITSIIKTKYIMGIPLKELAKYINHQEKKSLLIGQDAVKFMCSIYKNHIRYLEQGIYTDEDEEVRKEMQLLNNIKFFTYYAFSLQRLYLEGQTQEAYELVENITINTGFLKGHITYMNLLFYTLLTRLDRHETIKATEKRKNKLLIKKHMKELKYWISIYKENHYGRYLLVKAEYVAVFQKGKLSEKLYNEAINFAENRGDLQLEAIGNHLTAKYYKDNKKLSKFYAMEAVNLYKKWGAMYIADLVENKFKLNNNTKLTTEEKQFQLEIEKKENIENNKQINKNILYHLNKIQDMEEEEGFIYILDFLVESNHIDYGAVLFEKSDDMYLQYEKRNNRKVIVRKNLTNMKHVSYMSRKVIRYVARTGEEVILNQKPDVGIFTKDIYIMDKDEVSIICIPIKYLDVFVGIIYLEKMFNDGFDEKISITIKSIIPSLISKRAIIKDINIHNLLNPKEVDSDLTNRELEVLKLAAEGMSNSAISKELHITLGTVKTHLSNIYSKLGVDSRIKAVIKAKEINVLKI